MRAALIRHVVVALVLCTLAACAAQAPRVRVELPPLRLAPADLGRELALQQRLSFVFGAQQRELDALLEVDADAVRLAVQALGRSGATLVWDGKTLQQTRADWLPDTVRGERVLDDLQFVYWPLAALQAALPEGWRVEQTPDGGIRRLLQADAVWLEATYRSNGSIELDNRADGYRLTVQSIDLTDAAP